MDKDKSKKMQKKKKITRQEIIQHLDEQDAEMRLEFERNLKKHRQHLDELCQHLDEQDAGQMRLEFERNLTKHRQHLDEQDAEMRLEFERNLKKHRQHLDEHRQHLDELCQHVDEQDADQGRLELQRNLKATTTGETSVDRQRQMGSQYSQRDTDMAFIDGQIKLSHGLFQRGRYFLSVVCYYSPQSLYQQIVASLKKISFKEIYRDNFLMNDNQKVPIRMECFDEDFYEFEPQQYLLTPTDIKSKPTVRFPFLLRHLKEPKDEVDIRYIVDGFPAPLAVIVHSIEESDSERFDSKKSNSTFDLEKKLSGRGILKWNEGMGSNAHVTYRPPINMDRLTVAISDAISEGIFDSEKQQLELQWHPPNAGMKIGPEGGNLSLDECSFTILPGAIALQLIDKSETELIGVKSNETETAGAIAIPDSELPRLGFRQSPPHADKEIGPKGKKLSHDKCSPAISSKSLVDTRNLSALVAQSVGEFPIPFKSLVDTRNLRISVSMDFQKLGIPANRIPVSPYFGVNFDGKLRIPAKARVPTWFKALEDSNHGIKIYKRYRDEENKFVWRELQNEVKVHDDVIEFEVDHCCGFLATIKDWVWGNGEIKLSHGLYHLHRNFCSVVCYRSPKSLFQNAEAELKEMGYKKIHRDDFQTHTNRQVSVEMECYKMDLHKFDPPQYPFTLSDLKAKDSVRLPFLLQHLIEPKDVVDIKYIVNGFPAPLAVTMLPATKAMSADGFKLGDGASVKIEGDVNVNAGDQYNQQHPSKKEGRCC